MSLDRFLLALVCAAGAAGLGLTQPPSKPAAASPAPPTDLADYVRKDDKAFAWKLAGKTPGEKATVYDLDLTSQTWHDITWTHKVQLFVPKGTKPGATVVLWNQGGAPNATSALIGLQIAEKVGAPVAFLFGIPNQPLLGDKKEDALIAETFVRFLDSKDSSWPLLFPMVKSVVRAMDAVQACAKQEWQADVKDFIITGASKRGWTSWLTAATGDPRVKAIAPLVIDTLNFPAQMRNQVVAFGKPSEMVRDYTERKLIPIPDTAEARKLWSMVDPWVYRESLTVPKMIINGTNDPYWPLDALNSYWDDLKGEKHVLYVPNAGHDLRERDKDGKPELIPTRGVNTLAAFCKSQITGKPLPKLTWEFEQLGQRIVLRAKSDTKFQSIRWWEATTATRDFRPARWGADSKLEGDRATVGGGSSFDPVADRYKAFFAEAEYDVDGLRFTLSTQIRVLEPKK